MALFSPASDRHFNLSQWNVRIILNDRLVFAFSAREVHDLPLRLNSQGVYKFYS